jgi:hypothetical protein
VAAGEGLCGLLCGDWEWGLNTFLSGIVAHLEQEGVPVAQVLTVLNPDVTNADKSVHFIAVILDKVNKFGVSTDRCLIEKAIDVKIATKVGTF